MATPAAGPDVSVRPARLEDAPSVARVQLDAWKVGYADILPAALLEGLTVEAAAATWQQALEHPPTPKHLLLVAVEEGRVVGMAASGPSSDTDTPGSAELLALFVHPNWPRKGHGSRLLTACVDTWREQGFTHAVAWTFEADKRMQNFLEGAGFGFDGVTRAVEVAGERREQVRVQTTL